jgi:hypothetical protein
MWWMKCKAICGNFIDVFMGLDEAIRAQNDWHPPYLFL